MGDRLSTSYSSVAWMKPLRIDFTSVTARRCLRVRNRNVDASCRTAAQPCVGIAVTTPVSAIVVVTENATELVRHMSSAVIARRIVD